LGAFFCNFVILPARQPESARGQPAPYQILWVRGWRAHTVSEPQPATPGKDRRRGEVRAKLTINEERKPEADAPTGSRFKGCASFLVQDLVIRPHVTDFLRACWRTPDGKTVIAPLPPGVDGLFGPELRRLVLALYHQGQVTAGRLVTLLRGSASSSPSGRSFVC
jgi:hypothetical protein